MLPQPKFRTHLSDLAGSGKAERKWSTTELHNAVEAPVGLLRRIEILTK